jgi:hypothetical protein
MTAMPLRASICKASCLFNVHASDIETSRRFLFGYSIDLVARCAQTRNAIPVVIAFPCQELIDREPIPATDFSQGDLTSANGDDDRRFTARRPSLRARRCFPDDAIGVGNSRAARFVRFHVGFPPISLRP